MADSFAQFFVEKKDGKECAVGTVQGPEKELKNLKDNDPIIQRGILEMPEDFHEYADKEIRVNTTTLYKSIDAVPVPDLPYPIKLLGNIEIRVTKSL